MRYLVWSLASATREIHRDEVSAETPVAAAEAVTWPGHLVLAVFPAGAEDELSLTRAVHRDELRAAIASLPRACPLCKRRGTTKWCPTHRDTPTVRSAIVDRADAALAGVRAAAGGER